MKTWLKKAIEFAVRGFVIVNNSQAAVWEQLLLAKIMEIVYRIV
jgi:hypothetical protein